jgi:glycerophosphoryl diester phosphodiesterase
MAEKFEIHGHRGARGHLPENTLSGFILALEFGATAVELDVVISGDQQVVVSHEAWMNEEICSVPDGTPVRRGTGKEFNLYRMTYAEIKQFDCGKRGHHEFPLQVARPSYKPLLREVVATVETHAKKRAFKPVAFNIEIKTEEPEGLFNPAPADFLDLVLREIAQHDLGKRVSIQSFDMRVLKELRIRKESVKTGLLVENQNGVAANINDLGFVPDTYSPEFTLVNERLVKDVHARGSKIIPWTVNEIKDMERLILLGVDGIITDYPDRVANLLREKNIDF